MLQAFKYILVIIGIILIAYLPSMHNVGHSFDPIDANDLATISAKKTNSAYVNYCFNTQHQEISNGTQQQHKKSIKLKRLHIQFVLVEETKNNFLIAGADDTHVPSVIDGYRHLYNRDINPPPRC